MGNRATADERWRELQGALDALDAWFRGQGLPRDCWHEIAAQDIDRNIAVRLVAAVENAIDIDPEWGRKYLHEEPFATLWSHTKYGVPNIRRFTQTASGSFSVGNPASPIPARDWAGMLSVRRPTKQVAKARLATGSAKSVHDAGGPLSDDRVTDLGPQSERRIEWSSLTDRQRYSLRVLFRLGAFDAGVRRRADDIAKKAEGPQAKVEGFKSPLAGLVRSGLLASKTGREGGYWLTDTGRRLLTAIERDQSASDPSR